MPRWILALSTSAELSGAITELYVPEYELVWFTGNPVGFDSEARITHTSDELGVADSSCNFHYCILAFLFGYSKKCFWCWCYGIDVRSVWIRCLLRWYWRPAGRTPSWIRSLLFLEEIVCGSIGMLSVGVSNMGVLTKAGTVLEERYENVMIRLWSLNQPSWESGMRRAFSEAPRLLIVVLLS